MDKSTVKMRGAELVRGAERTGDRVRVLVARDLGLGHFVRRTLDQANKHHLPAFAGNLAFRALFALFPSLVALLWLLSVFHAQGLINALLNVASTPLPQAAADSIREQMRGSPAASANGAFPVGALFSVLVAVWAISATFEATMEAMNAMYAVEESRSFWRRQLTALSLSFAVSALLVGSLVLVVFGPRIADAARLGPVLRWAWAIGTWPVLLVSVLVAFALVYYFAPDVNQRFRWISEGSLIAAALWLLFALLFSLYFNNFVPYTEMYGSLAGIAVLMLYTYASSYILLLGAEMNQVIEMHDPRGKNEGEKVPDAEKPQQTPR